MKKLIIIVLIFFASTAIGQRSDTIYVEKVLVKNQAINIKTGKVMHKWWTKTKVKSGYILRQPDGMFLINGKIMEPDNFSYKNITKRDQQ